MIFQGQVQAGIRFSKERNLSRTKRGAKCMKTNSDARKLLIWAKVFIQFNQLRMKSKSVREGQVKSM